MICTPSLIQVGTVETSGDNLTAIKFVFAVCDSEVETVGTAETQTA